MQVLPFGEMPADEGRAGFEFLSSSALPVIAYSWAGDCRGGAGQPDQGVKWSGHSKRQPDVGRRTKRHGPDGRACLSVSDVRRALTDAVGEGAFMPPRAFPRMFCSTGEDLTDALKSAAFAAI